MPRAQKFATGKYAWGLCDTCGFRYRLNDLVENTVRGKRTGILACPTCNDPDHPQNFLDKYMTTDPQALRRSRPQIDLPGSRRLFPTNIWLRGERPDIPTQEMLLTDQAIKDSNARIEADWENRRFWRSNQFVQRGIAP